jgi:hypothetical protein
MNIITPKITFLTEDPIEKQIIDLFWEYSENNKFTHELKDIANRYNISLQDVCVLVNEKSFFSLICSNVECNVKHIKASIERDFDISTFISKNTFLQKIFCKKCIEKQISKITAQQKKKKENILETLKLEAQSDSWKELNPELLNILIIISEEKDKGEIIKRLPKTIEGKLPWDELKLLAKKNLIWMERESDSNPKIIKYHLDDKLRFDIKKHQEAEHFNSRSSQRTPQNKLTFRLLKSNESNSFKGVFPLKQTVEFIKDSLVQYEAIINDDGTITIDIFEKE